MGGSGVDDDDDDDDDGDGDDDGDSDEDGDDVERVVAGDSTRRPRSVSVVAREPVDVA